MFKQFKANDKLLNILKSINSNPYRYTEQEIIYEVDNFLPSQTCDYAAQGYFSIISHICFYRTEIERELIKIAIKPLYYYGISDPEEAISWVYRSVKEKKMLKRIQPYYTSRQGRKWIESVLVNKQFLIRSLIEEIVMEDN